MKPLRSAAMLATLGAALLAAPAAAQAQAPVAYGGGTHDAEGTTGTSLSLQRLDDGRLFGSVGINLRCSRLFPNQVVRLTGAASGDSFTAGGTRKLTRRGRLHISLQGTFAGETARGTLTARGSRIKGCRKFTRDFLVRAERAPAGAATGAPAAGTFLAGVTSQTASGLRLPVLLHSTGARVSANWHATMKCGPRAVLTVLNFTPATTVAADGSFTKSERYTIRYGDGSRDTFRVTFSGRFLSDGATGTLRARMQTRKKGKRYYPCDSGAVSWTATAP